MEHLNDLFKGLNNSSIEGYCKSGTIKKRIGELASTTIHVCAQFYPWDKKPRYFAARAFYANCSFADATSKTLMAEYNKKNTEKIMQFASLAELEEFINK